MQAAAESAGLKEAAVFAIAMYSVQGLAGYPITALCLHSEGKKLIKEWHEVKTSLTDAEIARMKTIGLTTLYGFPCDAIITEMTCNSLTQDPDERGYLMSKMFPSMVVGGFITVTITSVIFAGYFARLLGASGGVLF